MSCYDSIMKWNQGCESVLFIGTQFSNLYTAVDTDKTEDDVIASFLIDLNIGILSTRYNSVDCENYDEQDTVSLQLSNWLCKAKFLFTQLESTKLSALQISIDVFGSISRALSQLPVLNMPDLV